MNDNEKEIISNEEMTVDSLSDENVTANHQAETDSETNATGETALLQNELNSWKDKYMRLFAEFDNYKKRTSKEMSDVIKTAGKDIVLSMLDVMDDSERAEKQMEKATDIDAVKEGVQLIINKLKHVLQVKGVKAFDSIGEEFNVEIHEAITEIPAPTPDMEGKVIDQVQKGYYMHDKLIRHAKVVVGKTS